MALIIYYPEVIMNLVIIKENIARKPIGIPRRLCLESFIKSSELLVEAINIGLKELQKRSSQIQNGQNNVQTPSKNKTNDND